MNRLDLRCAKCMLLRMGMQALNKINALTYMYSISNRTKNTVETWRSCEN